MRSVRSGTRQSHTSAQREQPTPSPHCAAPCKTMPSSCTVVEDDGEEEDEEEEEDEDDDEEETRDCAASRHACAETAGWQATGSPNWRTVLDSMMQHGTEVVGAGAGTGVGGMGKHRSAILISGSTLMA